MLLDLRLGGHLVRQILHVVLGEVEDLAQCQKCQDVDVILELHLVLVVLQRQHVTARKSESLRGLVHLVSHRFAREHCGDVGIHISAELVDLCQQHQLGNTYRDEMKYKDS